jgi:hypothetical protein
MNLLTGRVSELFQETLDHRVSYRTYFFKFVIQESEYDRKVFTLFPISSSEYVAPNGKHKVVLILNYTIKTYGGVKV